MGIGFFFIVFHLVYILLYSQVIIYRGFTDIIDKDEYYNNMVYIACSPLPERNS